MINKEVSSPIGEESKKEKLNSFEISQEDKSFVFSFRNLQIEEKPLASSGIKRFNTNHFISQDKKNSFKKYNSDSGKGKIRKALRNIEFFEDKLVKQRFTKKETMKKTLNEEKAIDYDVIEILIKNQSTRENLQKIQDNNFLSVPKQAQVQLDSPLLSDASFDENNNVLSIGQDKKVYNSNMNSKLSSKIHSFKDHGTDFVMYETVDSKQKDMLPFLNYEEESIRELLVQSDNLFEINEFEEEYENKAINMDSIKSIGSLNELEVEEWDE